jgi:hypothetical protein
MTVVMSEGTMSALSTLFIVGYTAMIAAYAPPIIVRVVGRTVVYTLESVARCATRALRYCVENNLTEESFPQYKIDPRDIDAIYTYSQSNADYYVPDEEEEGEEESDPPQPQPPARTPI